MGAMASQITSLAIVYSAIESVADKKTHQSSASLDFASNAEYVSIWWRHHELLRNALDLHISGYMLLLQCCSVSKLKLWGLM